MNISNLSQVYLKPGDLNFSAGLRATKKYLKKDGSKIRLYEDKWFGYLVAYDS
jgi:hypothetical protein